MHYHSQTYKQEEEQLARQFIGDTLSIKLPEKSLQDILKDGIILCEFIKRFSPKDLIIIKNEGRTKFAYQDNIAQFLRAAENVIVVWLHIPQSDLFQTVDLLEGKRMQSVTSCLLAIKRIMEERKVIRKTNHGNSMTKSTRNLLTPYEDTPYLPRTTRRIASRERITEWPKTDKVAPVAEENKPKKAGGYVKSQVKMLATMLEAPSFLSPQSRTMSSDEINIANKKNNHESLLSLPQMKPSKSTSEMDESYKIKTRKMTHANKFMQNIKEQNNRKTSLKKMGSFAITVESDDGKCAVYALGASIGKGQFGEVFGGLNMDTGEYVAVKRIKRNEMDCDDMNEVGVLKHLNNEHIVRYKGFSKDSEYLNIILEYVEMGSLYHNIKSFGKFPEKLAASYTYKILCGLNYLHNSEVVHCDLKAANILTTKTGGLKLTDFGVSLSLKMKDNKLTGEPAGTPNWMAPEVIKLNGVSTKSDIWSLGCTVVEMLTGKPPYSGMPSLAALYRIVEDDQPPIPTNVPMSREAIEFLLQCFNKNPDNRPTAHELMNSAWMKAYHSVSNDLPPTSSIQRSNTQDLWIKELPSTPSIESSDVYKQWTKELPSTPSIQSNDSHKQWIKELPSAPTNESNTTYNQSLNAFPPTPSTQSNEVHKQWIDVLPQTPSIQSSNEHKQWIDALPSKNLIKNNSKFKQWIDVIPSTPPAKTNNNNKQWTDNLLCQKSERCTRCLSPMRKTWMKQCKGCQSKLPSSYLYNEVSTQPFMNNSAATNRRCIKLSASSPMLGNPRQQLTRYRYLSEGYSQNNKPSPSSRKANVISSVMT
ncbi:kinase-like domain-containing protein [Pilobolus umbonatus]|nr:kinase-like domain-containing protein [Pilobolus umbonatus]